jgi:lipid-A-disaccharide synthase
MPAPAASPVDAARPRSADARAAPPGRGPAPRAAVNAELARALGAALATPVHAAAYLARRRSARAELEALLAAPAPEKPSPAAPTPARTGARRELHVFVSAAERSGETHAVSFVRALRAEARALGLPEPRLRGLGGERLAAEGVELLARPVDRAVMGLKGVLGSLRWYLDLLEACAASFAAAPPDVLVPVDSPALHVPLARIAGRYGTPTVHFVAPQYWGWAPWRARAYGRAIATALTILPFEPAWFERRGVHVAHVGHPLLDALAAVPATRPAEDARAIVVLPGSRTAVLERNLPWMLARLAAVDGALGHPPIVLAHDDAGQIGRLERIAREHGAGLDLSIAHGDLHATLARARTAFSVSGTVLLDVLHHRLPTVVAYRLGGRREAWLAHAFLTPRWFAAPNLLAGRGVLPEFAFAGEGPRAEVEAALVRAHGDAAWRAGCVAGLEDAARRLGPAGASARAARIVLATAERSWSAPAGSAEG